MAMMDAKAFGEKIRAERKRHGVTQMQLAATANTGTRFISELEKGKPTTQLDKALRVAGLLGIRFVVPSAIEK